MDRAVQAADNAAAAFPSDRATLMVVARAYARRGERNRDEKDFKIARRHLRTVEQSGPQDVRTYTLLGAIQTGLRRYDDAVGSIRKALEMAPDDASATYRLALAYRDMGQYERALPYFINANELAQAAQQDLLPVCAYQIAYTHALLGNYEKGIEQMRRALSLAPDQFKDTYKEYVYFVECLKRPDADVRAWTAHKELADYHKKANRPDRALEEFKQMAPAKIGGEWRDHEHWLGWTHTQTAFLYRKLRNNEPAIEEYKKAIEWFAKIDDKRCQALTHMSLAHLYDDIGYLDQAQLHATDPQSRLREWRIKALENYEKAGPLLKEANELESLEELQSSICFIRAALFGISDPFVQQYRETMRAQLGEPGLPLTPERIEATQMIADLDEIENGGKETEQSFLLRESLVGHYESLRPEQLGDLHVSEYTCIAEGYRDFRGDDEKAIYYYEKAIEKGNLIRERRTEDSYRRSATSLWMQSACSNLVNLYAKQGKLDESFRCAEQYKGRALLDLLGSSSPTDRGELISSQELEKAQVQSKIASLQKQVETVRSSGEDTAVRSLERSLELEKTSYNRLDEDISVANLEVRHASSNTVSTLDDCSEIFREATFISYLINPDEASTAVVVHEGDVSVIPLPLDGAAILPGLIDRLRNELGVSKHSTRDLTVEQSAEQQASSAIQEASASKELFRILLQPLLPKLTTRQVIISPYDVLNYVPFEALQDESGRYFIEDHVVSYTPNASVLKFCMDKQRTGKESVLALGNPNLKNPEFRLFNAEDEVNALEAMFTKSKVLTFDGATETAVKAMASDYDIVHFACHGELNLDEPMLTSLRLAPDAENDGYLHAGEVFELKLRASLVVLSACNSALGELKAGNELMGLTRSFLYAGTPSIIASLWKVDDRSTSFLMQRFYTHLQTMGKAEALRQAKLETMKEFPSPYHWAAFCLQGDYR